MSARRIALVVLFAGIPLATGAVIAASDLNAFLLFIAPEIWIGATIAVTAAVARSRSAYGQTASALGATGAAIGYGVLAFPLLAVLGYVAAGGDGIV